MTLKEQINADFMTAFKNQDKERKTLLGVLKGEIQLQESKTDVTDEVVLGIVRKLEKSLLQMNTEESLKELEYIKPYLPTMMPESFIREKVQTYINSGITTFGQIMSEFNKRYKGQVDNKILSEIIKDFLK